MIVLLVILSAAVIYLLAAQLLTLVLRCPVREVLFSGDDILIKLPRGRLPLRVRMKLTVTEPGSGESGELDIRTAVPADGVIRVRSGAKKGTELNALLCDIRVGVMGAPICKCFGSRFNASLRLPPVRTVKLCRRDDDMSAGAPEGVREFAHGDRLRDLHVKLSAKCGKYMVRERGVNSYVYSVTETERAPLIGGKPEPSFGKSSLSATLADELCAGISCILWLTVLKGISGALPWYAVAAGGAVAAILILSRRLKKLSALFSAVFLLMTAAAGIAGAGQLTSQTARAVNLLSKLATARFDRLFPLLKSGKPDIFAICFLTELTVWAMYSLNRSRFAAVRLIGAAVTLAPLLLFCRGGYALPAGIAAVLLAAAPWRSYGLRGAIIPAIAAGVSCAVFSASAGAHIADEATMKAEKAIYGGSIAQPCGRVSDIPQPEGGSPALEVVMDEPCAVYLHGFTGFSYDGGSWSAPHSDELSVSQEELLSLKEGGFFADSQPLLLARSAGADVATQRVTVRRLNADGRYAYLTDGAEVSNLFPAGLENPAAGSTVSFDAVSDIFSASEELTEAAKNADENYLGGAALLDRIYRTDYTRIPASAERVLSARLGENETDAAQAASLIRRMLDGCEYDPSAEPQSAEDFLQKTRCGNSCAYASAAALAFRYLGIPARYAEGYALTKDAAGSAAGGAVTLTADDFHAWAEYYVEGVGWLPFEAVPEYLDLMPRLPASGELSENGVKGGSGEAPDEASGSRVYSRLPDEQKNETEDRTLIIYPIALAGLLIGYGVYLLLRLELDPLFALEKCAAALKVSHDAAGSYDLSGVDRAGTRERFEKLERHCIERVYSPSPTKRCGGAAAYFSCITGRRKS